MKNTIKSAFTPGFGENPVANPPGFTKYHNSSAFGKAAANRLNQYFRSFVLLSFLVANIFTGKVLSQGCLVPEACGVNAPPYKVICAPGTEIFSNTLYNQQLLNPTLALTTPQFIVIFGTLVIAENYTFAEGSVIVVTDDSGIRIRGGANLTLKQTHVRGCDKLWNSIQVDATAKLTATKRTTFEDAIVAINLRNNASLYLDNCTFKQNFISISSAQAVASSLGSITIRACEFSGADQLPETYIYNCNGAGFNDSQANFPLYAIEVSNTNSFLVGIGSTALTRNWIHDYTHAPLFTPCEGVPTGVRAINTNVTIRNTTFQNIGTGGTPPHGAPEVGGRGVDFSSSNGSHKLTLVGIGKYSTPTFQNCHWFVLSRRGRVQITNAFGTQTTFGIEIQNAPNTLGSVTITNCRVENYTFRAITSLAEVSPAGQTVVQNTSVNDNSEDTYENSPRFGITLMNNTVPANTTHWYYLYADTFTNFNKAIQVPFTFGFDVNRMIGVTAHENLAINNETASGQYNGFRVYLGRQNTFTWNQVFSGALPNAGYNPLGIYVESAGRSNYYCNCLWNSRQDFSFNGFACDQTRLIRNTMMNNNTTGLFLAGPTIVGVQNDFDNSWPTDQGASLVEEARFNTNPANQFLINASAVRVFEQETPGSNAWAQPRFPSGTSWFQPALTNNNLQCPVDEFQKPVDERTVADEYVLNNQFPAYMGYPATIWDAKFRLFEKLADNPGLRPSGSPEESFYNAELNTNLGKLSDVSSRISRIGEPSGAMLNSMLAQAADLDNLLTELEAIDIALGETEDPGETTNLEGQRAAKVVEIENASLAYNQTLSAWSSEVSSRRQNLNTQLASITPATTWEQNLKSVLEVALQLLATTEIEKSYTGVQQTALYAIAYQCAHEGGHGVLLARAMLNLNLDMDYNCTQQLKGGSNDRTEIGDNFGEIEIYPNPAQDILTIRTNDPTVFNAVKIFNAFGEVVYQTENVAAGILEIPAEKMPNGIYTVQVLSGERLVLSSKVVFVH